PGPATDSGRRCPTSGRPTPAAPAPWRSHVPPLLQFPEFGGDLCPERLRHLPGRRVRVLDGPERVGHERICAHAVEARVDHSREDELTPLHPPRPFFRFTPFQTEVPFRPALRACRDERHEDVAAGNGAFDLSFPVVTRFERALVEPDDIAFV